LRNIQESAQRRLKSGGTRWIQPAVYPAGIAGIAPVLYQPCLLQDSHVVGNSALGQAEGISEVTDTSLALSQHEDDPQADWVGQRG